MNINLNQYDINRTYQSDLRHQAQQMRLANSVTKTESGANLITTLRNSVGNLLTNIGVNLQERYAETPITATTTGTFSHVEA